MTEPLEAGRMASDDRAAYTLQRVLARRSVRLALALSGLRRGRALSRELLSEPMSLDAPLTTGTRYHYPEFRVAYTGSGDVCRTSTPAEQLQPQNWRARLEYLQPDLILIDGAGPTTTREILDPLIRTATRRGIPVTAVGDGVTVLTAEEIRSQQVIAMPWSFGSEHPINGRALPVFVDPSTSNPVGLTSTPRGIWTPQNEVGQSDLQDAADSAVAVLPVGRLTPHDHARSVLHLLACGVPVVSQRTPLLVQLLGPNEPCLVGSAQELEAAAQELSEDQTLQERTSVRLRRHVLGEHGSRRAFELILDAVGLPARPRPEIAVLLASRRPELIPSTLQAIDRQTYPSIRVELLLHGVPFDLPSRAMIGRRPIRVHEVPADRPLGQVLNIGLDETRSPLIAKMDDDDLYGSSHLTDLALAMEYSGAGAVGRWSNVVHLEASDRTVHQHTERQERWAHHLPGCTLLVHGDLLRTVRWRHVPRGVDTELVRSIYGAGERCYSTHRFGFIRRRHGDHTFLRGDRSFAREGPSQPGLDTSVLEV